MSDHRCGRLLERYGLSLTPEEIDALLPACTPANRLRRGEHGDMHLIRYGPIDLIAVVRLVERTNQRTIVTFMAPDYFTAGRRTRDSMACVGKAGKLGGWIRDKRLRRRQERRQESAT